MRCGWLNGGAERRERLKRDAYETMSPVPGIEQSFNKD